ncbi:lytic transglycosylase domain-containing protein [Variovorax sp. J22R133]|uniref:lytic transglycosylase domain-containing protein n=1 Tax=Variovorax brevis TaxID=3053503 RepID=UPI002575535B|nr:lytic transglycosylase domain-containing protein [Variovorax sp. J22R133]MDM0116774.1 lytic transglycosylase domain-containing protein [Variovorax sp. J22R133]
MFLSADLIERCAPEVSPVLMQALVRNESAGRPLAIGMDKGQGTVKQPATLGEAIATAKELTAAGRKFSVGLAQIHISNVALYGMTWEQAFDACQNLAVGQKILWNFYHRASASGYSGVAAIWAALRGYNSGGVERAVSDEYANRIFVYMSSAPQQVHLGTGVPVTKASKASPLLPAATEGSAAENGKAKRPGESLDIFERTKQAGL